jgi:hypothetical protein
LPLAIFILLFDEFMGKPPIKLFNTVGSCIPSEHYMLPVLPRLPEVDELIEDKFYFVIHAPRQSGKTTFLNFLNDEINSQGKYYSLYCSLSTLKNIADRHEAIIAIHEQLNKSMYFSDIDLIAEKAYSYNTLPFIKDTTTSISMMLTKLCSSLDKDLVILFDEADCLSGDGLISFLGQIHDSYLTKGIKLKFPSSIALVGMRNIRDYLSQVRPEAESKGPVSPFNIIKKALILSNFTSDEIKTLYNQHTEASGQVFEPSAIERAWYWSEGQPWLVNALAYEAVTEILKKQYSEPITGPLIDLAAEALIKRRDTHIDSLLERLKEPRVIRVMDPVFAGTKSKISLGSDDRQYCLDLGLVTEGEDRNLRPANGIYQEIMSRALTDDIQKSIDDRFFPTYWTDGKIIFMNIILKRFQNFWLHDSDSFPKRPSDLADIKYDEATVAFSLLAYLQKVLSAGARVHRNFSEGRGSVDICVIFHEKKYLIEIKLKDKEISRKKSLAQLAGYLDASGEKEGWLVVFDRNRQKSREEKIYWKTVQLKGVTIHIVGC